MTDTVSVALIGLISAVVGAVITGLFASWRTSRTDGAKTAQDGWRELFAAERERQAEERKEWLRQGSEARTEFEDRLASVENVNVDLRGRIERLEQQLSEARGDVEAAYAEIRELHDALSRKDEHIEDRDNRIRGLRVVRAALEGELRRHGMEVPAFADDMTADTDIAPERRTPVVTADAVVVTSKEHDQ